MRIAVFALDQFAVDEVVALLRNEYGDVLIGKLTTDSRPQSGVQRAVLIYPGLGVVSIGEKTTIVRDTLGADCRITLCIPQPTPNDRQLLADCGASEIISPRSWSPGHVAERILGELLLASSANRTSFGLLRGGTRLMQDLYREIGTLAPLDEPILILGETGTGKELVAQELHKQSGRTGQFLPILCPAVSPELMPSELFGHKEGSFTDARHNRRGMLTAAAEGTAFLDEIGDLDSKAQAQLLRVLDDGKVKPVGSNVWEAISARIVMATNRNLEQQCAEGKFRYDLYMRLHGFIVRLPPLRERRADLSLLAEYFVDLWDQQHGTSCRIPNGALDCLYRYDWPGNVRELRKMMERAAAFSEKTTQFISAAMLQDSVTIGKSGPIDHKITFNPLDHTLRDVIKRCEREYIQSVLALERGNKEAAAKRAGLSRSQFYEKIKEIE